MSLESLLRLRRSGHVPADPITVIVGKPPAWLEDDASHVVIDRDPAGMDLHALVGLPIHLIDIQGDTSLLLRAMDATEAAGAKPLGACTAAGACGVSPEHELAMSRYRENLCLTR